MRNSIINRQFRYTFSNITMVIFAINVIIYFITSFAYPPAIYYLAMSPSAIVYGHWYWQFFTYMFVHANLSHLIFNMFGLLIFGQLVERSVGTREFLLYYLLCGTLSGIASFFVYYFSGMNTILLGASGALYSVMLLFAVLYPNAIVNVFMVIPVRAWLLVTVYFLIEFFGQYVSDGIAHSTHLFGLLFGLLYCIIRLRMNPIRRIFS